MTAVQLEAPIRNEMAQVLGEARLTNSPCLCTPFQRGKGFRWCETQRLPKT